MNSLDRQRISKIYEFLNAVPFPKDGSGSDMATMSGFVAYQKDMRVILPAISKMVYGMLLEGVEGLVCGDDYDDPDKMLEAIELWLADRKADHWKDLGIALPIKIQE